MRYNVTVSVPYSKKLPYTLFAKGSLISIPSVDDGADFVRFKFGGGTVFVLFYTFRGFRRAYIVTGWQNENDGEPVILPGVSERLCLIFTARGRRIDHLKRVLHILTDEQGDDHKAFSLPLIFWYRLSALIQHDGAHRSDIEILWEQFTKQKLLRLTKNDKRKLIK
ncbi:MAG: hypothetical protein IJ530_01055 [Treponema sp.]|uniref:hypothetical protein n=1 Tax=Treponema sp. TaxID=166 RepID=UPI0025E6904D|nr:hypothetical protein [Treponema sp.]MBQ8678333.1 hypothetical protein [Treponema sp.]